MLANSSIFKIIKKISFQKNQEKKNSLTIEKLNTIKNNLNIWIPSLFIGSIILLLFLIIIYIVLSILKNKKKDYSAFDSMLTSSLSVKNKTTSTPITLKKLNYEIKLSRSTDDGEKSFLSAQHFPTNQNSLFLQVDQLFRLFNLFSKINLFSNLNLFSKVNLFNMLN